MTVGILALGVLSASSAGAQTLDRQYATPATDIQAPAHISVVDGVAVLERDGQRDDAPGNMPLLAGDRVRTGTGRVEILFADGSTLHLDHHSAIDLQSDELVRLLEGRIRISIPGPSREVAYRVDGPHGWAQILQPGDYRIALLNGPGGSELEVAVLRGQAELANEDGRTSLRAGERAFARANAAPSYAYVVNSAAWDAFDRWSEARRDERLRASAEYLPDEVQPYAASFERYGYWRNEPTYGRVWYPRVAPDWRPYYRGRWVLLRPYGWTWVAHDPWGWPTHHYGRWGHSTAGWFWIPGRTWGAAWVSWAYAPGYVSWCPLGWNNRPVFQININIGRGYDPWRAWTVIPRRHFGVGYVHRYVVRAAHLDDRTRGAFTYQDRGPDVVGYAVPRASAPIRVAGARDGRRGTPLYTNLPADRARTTSDGARVRMADPRAPATSGARPRPGSAAAAPSVQEQRSSRPSLEGASARAPRPSTAGSRPAVQRARPGVQTSRPSDQNGRVRAVPRERAVPVGPATRIERPETGARARPQAPASAGPPRSAPPPRATPRASPLSDERRTGRVTAPSDGRPGSRRPVPMPQRAQPTQARDADSPGVRRAVPRMDAPAPTIDRRRSSGAVRPAPPMERGRPPAVTTRPAPPSERSRPAAVGRPSPSGGSPGSNGPAAGSTSGKPPAAAKPAQGNSGQAGGRGSAGARPGARPRPGGRGGGGR